MSDNAQQADGSLDPVVVTHQGWVLDPDAVAKAVALLDDFDNQLTGLLAHAGSFFKLMDESNMKSAEMRWDFRNKVCEDYAEKRQIKRESSDEAWRKLMHFIKAQPQWAAFVIPEKPLSQTADAVKKRATREKTEAKPKDPRVEAANAEKARVEAEVAAEVKANAAKVKAAKEKINAIIAKVSHSAESTESLLAAVETRYRELLAPAKAEAEPEAEAKPKRK
jgi:hypothetical protein